MRSTLTVLLLFLLGRSASLRAGWTHERGRVTRAVPFDWTQAIVYHLHVPKAAGTTVKDLFPKRLAGVRLCDGFAEKLYSNVEKFRSAAAELAARAVLPCNFVSVEGDFEAGHLLGDRAVTFALLRDPLELWVSQLRHDIKKGKFSDVAQKYGVGGVAFAPYEQHMLGFEHNMQTLRIGAGSVERAMERLHQIQFGLVEHFHASVCLLLYAAQMTAQFRSSCRCGASPLAGDSADNVARVDAQSLNVTVDQLLTVWRNQTADRRLYSYAAELFLERVRFVEQESGVRLLCLEQQDDLAPFVRPLLDRQHVREQNGRPL
jgi:hypothetical protein